MTEGTQRRTLDFSIKKKIAFKALGGRAKAVYWHVGVAQALAGVGLRFAGGARAPGAARPYGNGVINPIIGSSSGAVFGAMVASGMSLEDLCRFPITREDIFSWSGLRPLDYLRRVRRSCVRRTGRAFRPWHVSIRDLMTMRPRYSVDALERLVRERLLPGLNDFSQLACELYILATALDTPRTVVFGERRTPQKHDYIYLNSVSVSQAAAASMALPPIFIPCKITIGGVETYFIDGELRDPFVTNVAQDAGADCIITSSIYQPFQFADEIGSLIESGLGGIYMQSRDLSIDAKQRLNQLNRQRATDAIRAVDHLTSRILSEEIRTTIIGELERILECPQSTSFLYVSPKKDLELYRIHPFDLSLETRNFVIRRGYHRAVEVLREWSVPGADKLPEELANLPTSV